MIISLTAFLSFDVENVILKAGLSEAAVTIDLTHKHGTVERIEESKIICTTDEKVFLFMLPLLCTPTIGHVPLLCITDVHRPCVSIHQQSWLSQSFKVIIGAVEILSSPSARSNATKTTYQEPWKVLSIYHHLFFNYFCTWIDIPMIPMVYY